MPIRDLFLSVFLVCGLPVVLRYPFWGICAYAWIGLMNPHRLTWGFSYDIQWAFIYGIVTLAVLITERDRQLVAAVYRFRLVILYLAWMTITNVMALEPARAEGRWLEMFKIYLMAIVTLGVLTSEKRIATFVTVAALSVGFFGIKGGWFTLQTGGAFRVWGPPGSLIEDNNQLAVALTMTVPLMYWMYRRFALRYLKWALLISIGLVVVSILGSHSRGALLALGAMGIFMVAKSDRKGLAALLFVLGSAVAIYFMPDEYWGRMKTIEAYEQDESAAGRINAWQTAINIANARITGGGFNFTGGPVFAIFAPDPNDVKTAHSIYFQALGEQGWIGLAMFLGIWWLTWRACVTAIKRFSSIPGAESMSLLASMLQVSLVGFLVGGAFVNIGYWDFPFYLSAVAFALGICRLDLQARTEKVSVALAKNRGLLAARF